VTDAPLVADQRGWVTEMLADVFPEVIVVFIDPTSGIQQWSFVSAGYRYASLRHAPAVTPTQMTSVFDAMRVPLDASTPTLLQMIGRVRDAVRQAATR